MREPASAALQQAEGNGRGGVTCTLLLTFIGELQIRTWMKSEGKKTKQKRSTMSCTPYRSIKKITVAFPFIAKIFMKVLDPPMA